MEKLAWKIVFGLLAALNALGVAVGLRTFDAVTQLSQETQELQQRQHETVIPAIRRLEADIDALNAQNRQRRD